MNNDPQRTIKNGTVGDWKDNLRTKLAESVAPHPYWSQRLASLSDGSLLDCALHLAVLTEPYLQFILDGTKTVESRFSRNRCAPYKSVAKGDVVVLKRVSGPIVGICEVAETWFFELDQPDAWRTVREEFGPAICPQEGFWEAREKAKVATLMRIERTTRLAPFPCAKKDRRGWAML